MRKPGRPCESCGGVNTDAGDFLSRPSVLFFIFFGGWLLVLLRTAFVKRSCTCRDCGAVTRYRTFGSVIAMVILLILTTAIVAEVLR